jgi:methionyl-tRNA formyltransferase
MIAADTSRSRAYLRAMIRHQVYPSHVLIMKSTETASLPGQVQYSQNHEIILDLKSAYHDEVFSEADFDPFSSLTEVLESEGIPYDTLPSVDINSFEVGIVISNRPESVLVYSGFGGVLLTKELLSCGKRFLHIHGGFLPDYKGSTTNYYSLIEKNKIGASAIFLTDKIDSGPVLMRREFPPPKEKIKIDHIYDSAVRASVLVEVLKLYQLTGDWNIEMESSNSGHTYFVIHPVLKHIAILSRK